MATRSRIGIKTKKGILSIYCHWDGYPEGVGVTLKNFYKTPKKVKELINLGNISVLDVKVAPNSVKLNFDDRIEGYTLPYTDRGEDKVIQYNKDVKDFLKNAFNSGEEYVYLFSKGKWYVYEGDSKFLRIDISLRNREKNKNESESNEIKFVG